MGLSFYFWLLTFFSLPAVVPPLSSSLSLKVRDMACTTLSGLLQCQFFPLDSSLQTQLQTLSQTCLPKARGELASTGTHTHTHTYQHAHTHTHTHTHTSVLQWGNHSNPCPVTLSYPKRIVSLEFLKPILICHLYVCVFMCRLSAAPCWSAGPQCLHPVQPLRRSTVDASDTDGPERPPQWPTAHRGVCPHIHTLTHTQASRSKQFEMKLYNFIVQLRRKWCLWPYFMHEEDMQWNS